MHFKRVTVPISSLIQIQSRLCGWPVIPQPVRPCQPGQQQKTDQARSGNEMLPRGAIVGGVAAVAVAFYCKLWNVQLLKDEAVLRQQLLQGRQASEPVVLFLGRGTCAQWHNLSLHPTGVQVDCSSPLLLVPAAGRGFFFIATAAWVVLSLQSVIVGIQRARYKPTGEDAEMWLYLCCSNTGRACYMPLLFTFCGTVQQTESGRHIPQLSDAHAPLRQPLTQSHLPAHPPALQCASSCSHCQRRKPGSNSSKCSRSAQHRRPKWHHPPPAKQPHGQQQQQQHRHRSSSSSSKRRTGVSRRASGLWRLFRGHRMRRLQS